MQASSLVARHRAWCNLGNATVIHGPAASPSSGANDEGSPVQSIADIRGAREHGVRFSRGDAGRAVHTLAEIGELIESGRFSLPIVQTFPLADVAEAHRVGEGGHGRGKLILVVG
jgi:NADPH:quinone reductase-like Zn-dependent oxidoreductase